MSKISSLVKVNLSEALDIRKFKQEKAKSISFVTFLLLISALFIFISVVYNLLMIFSFSEANLPLYHCFMLFGGVASLFIFFSAIVRIKSIFIGKDYDMLSAMPIKKSEIVISKLISLYLVELIY